MENPTNAQLKKFWQWCGLKHVMLGELGFHGQYPNHGIHVDLHLDLDNLFRYAIPKLKEMGLLIGLETSIEAHELVYYWGFDEGQTLKYSGEGHKNPALALFWAIWGVITNTASSAPSIQGGYGEGGRR